MSGVALLLLLAAVATGKHRRGALTAALLVAAVGGAFLATRRGLTWGESWAAMAAAIPLPILSLLIAAMVVSELARAAGVIPALTRMFRMRGGGFRAALAPMLLDLGDPAAAERVIWPAAGDRAAPLRAVGNACGVAGSTFGGTVWLGVLVAAEAVHTAPADVLWLVRVITWSGCALLALVAYWRLPPHAPSLEGEGEGEGEGPVRWGSWAALGVLIATAIAATANPGHLMPVEAWALGGAAALWLLRPLERLLAWTLKRDPVLAEPPSLRAISAVVPSAALLAAGLLAGAAVAAVLPTAPAPVVLALLASGVAWPLAFEPREARAVAAAVALPLAHCSAGYGAAGAFALGVLLAGSPVLGLVVRGALARRGPLKPAPVP